MSKKLLLADDSITIQKVIGITFANEDYDLTIVDNGDAALQKAQADKPHLIMADVFMPGKNGYELCAAVKRDPNLKDVPVLLLTGTFEPFDEEKAISSGADGWIAKPFESHALIEKVEGLIGEVAPAASAQQPVAPTPPPQSSPVAPAPSARPKPATPTPPAEPDDWGDVSFDESPAEPAAAAEPPVFDVDSDFIIDDGAASDPADEADVWADSADPIEMVEPEPPVFDESPVRPAAPAPPPAASAPRQPAAPDDGAASKVASLSDEQLQQVVEKVASAVIERIAWEVVPDLAENMIKDEIRKIRDGA